MTLLDREQVKRLPVLDDLGRLVGIVSRADLLRVHLRSDAEIREDVVQEVLRRVLAVRDGLVTVEVRHGEVTLAGRLDRRSVVDIAGRLAAPGQWRRSGDQRDRVRRRRHRSRSGAGDAGRLSAAAGRHAAAPTSPEHRRRIGCSPRLGSGRPARWRGGARRSTRGAPGG
ncbi:CBS domain-containing protein [Micromonospora sp. RHAY321]|uniref:CBS domain-containing protein n=1 Tax=Micromonospora sp. RHAY321 TaxID=2944807 RepID=UPI00207C9C86|nr:CBS domain-containing protein [Micromonospora sp. RHAY321]MCO1594995.1 CBS domain-containing protein [Micromonospora sp. RHAY321]